MTCPICQNPAWVVPPPISLLPRILDPILPGPAWCTPGYFLIISVPVVLATGMAFVSLSDGFWWAPALFNPLFLNPRPGDILGINTYRTFSYQIVSDLPDEQGPLAGIHLYDCFIAFHVSMAEFVVIMGDESEETISALPWV